MNAPNHEPTLLGATLEGRHALVTGGARGVGFAVAGVLAARGARVTITSRDTESLSDAGIALGGATAGVCMDVCEPASIDRAIRRACTDAGPIDVLINNAGAVESAPFAETDRLRWDRMLAVNLTSVYELCRRVLPDMLERDWGRIVNIASVAGLKGYPYVSAYVAAKHGVVGLTRALAMETARTGVTVNAVCPGYADTQMTARALAVICARTGRDEAQARADLLRGNPQRRLVEPREVADAAAWLCGPDASAITGQSIAVAGGEVM